MYRTQKTIWLIVGFAGLLTAIAGSCALLSPRPPLPNLGALGDGVPPSMAGKIWAACVIDDACLGPCPLTRDRLANVKFDFERVTFRARADSDRVDALYAAARPPHHDPASGEIVLQNIAAVGDWSLTGVDGRPFTSADLGGRIWIADFIFTNCAGPCPLMCDVMQKLVKRLPDTPRLRFVSFSVDPQRDTPEVMREFAKKWDAPDRWKFVTGMGVYNLAYDGFKLEARPAEKPQPGAEFIHSSRFTLVDARGRMRGIYVYDYEKPESVGPLLDRIERDTRALLDTPERVIDHVHDRRFFLVDAQGRLRGAYASTEGEALARDARRLARTPERLLSARSLPALNATLNGASFVFLSMGLAFILNKKVTFHKACMTTALAASMLFLVSYLAYHFQVGSVKYEGAGLMRAVYFAILFSHTVLAVAVAPLAIVTVIRAWKGTFDRHVAIARWTLPVWMYVSLTGILVYLMLYRL